MNRTGKDSLTQIIRTAGIAPNRFQCKILKVLYANRRLKVTARGYTGPGKVPVQAGIVLGTPDNPKVYAGDQAIVERSGLDNRWYATAIIHKVKCAATNDPGTEVEVDTSSSFLVNDFAAQLVTPDSLFLPPLESLGDLWTPGQTPPTEGVFVEDGFNGTITSGTTQEQLYLGASVDRTMTHLTLVTTDTDVTLLVDVNGVNAITATRAAGAWTIQGSSAGSGDVIAAFPLPTPVAVVIGDTIRTAIQADGTVTALAYGLGAS